MKEINLEQAERALILAFLANIPVALWGRPGIGKSAILKKVAKRLGWKLYDIRLSDKEPSDLGGIPYPVDGKVQYLEPANLPIGGDEKAIAFFDEADRADMSTANVAFQWWLDRECNGHKFSPNVRVVLAGNGNTDTGTTPLSKAAANRACHLYLETRSPAALESYLKWADENGVSPLLRGFAKARQGIWSGEGDGTSASKPRAQMEEMAYATPRSFDYADRMVRTAYEVDFQTKDILPAIVAGCVGEGAATEFLAYAASYAEIPTIEEVVMFPDTAKVPSKPDLLFAFGIQLADHAAKNAADAGKIAQYALRWEKEPQRVFMQRLADKQPAVKADPIYKAWENPKGFKSNATAATLTVELQDAINRGEAVVLPPAKGWARSLSIPDSKGVPGAYVLSQRVTGEWGCGCKGAITHGHCKHLTKYGL